MTLLYTSLLFLSWFTRFSPSNESDENTDMCLNKSFLFIVLAYLKLSWLKDIKGNIKKAKILNYDIFIFLLFFHVFLLQILLLEKYQLSL